MNELRLRRDRLTWVEADDEVIALDEDALLYLNVNQSGAEIWRALHAGTTRDELVATLVQAYDVEPDRAGADIDRFVAELSQRGLLEQ